MSVRYSTLLIIAGMIVTGSLNSILTKYQDMQCVENCNDVLDAVYFDQPVMQTLQMFIGEMSCWLIVYILKFKSHKSADEPLLETVTDKRKPSGLDSFILAIPSTCDLLGTTLMNIGLLYVPVSIYQMTRGSIILIVGLMSVIYLKHKISTLEWMSLFVVFLGVFFVGLSGYLKDNAKIETIGEESSIDIVVGMTLIFTGIIMTAVQFVVEEHILSYLEIEPIEIVGYEGTYGTLVTLLGMLIGQVVSGKGYFDIYRSFSETISNPTVLYCSLLIMLSIAIFNYCGITMTKLLSATSRSTIDTTRTLLVWLISMFLGWESFNFLQLFAFFLLVLGTLSFNGVIQPKNWAFVPNWLKDLESDIHT